MAEQGMENPVWVQAPMSRAQLIQTRAGSREAGPWRGYDGLGDLRRPSEVVSDLWREARRYCKPRWMLAWARMSMCLLSA